MVLAGFAPAVSPSGIFSAITIRYAPFNEEEGVTQKHLGIQHIFLLCVEVEIALKLPKKLYRYFNKRKTY